jgi:hypothetical protein
MPETPPPKNPPKHTTPTPPFQTTPRNTPTQDTPYQAHTDLEVVEVELADEAREVPVSVVAGQDLGLQPLGILHLEGLAVCGCGVWCVWVWVCVGVGGWVF